MNEIERNCGMAHTMKIIGSKWTMMILYNLCTGTKRFGELQRVLDGISPKTLAERLKQLEEDGIVNKKVYAQVPLKVEYSLTEKGVSLKKIINQLDAWGADNTTL
ncbi:MAG: helix-turn-helix transcriptional regulator [Candidatus Levybacteria bacterium]|nr:helix-turn-helix transcriptional regulator [Candidatus Levybacteria bacterium]